MYANSRKLHLASIDCFIEWYGVDNVLATILEVMSTEELGRLVAWLYDKFDVYGDDEEY